MSVASTCAHRWHTPVQAWASRCFDHAIRARVPGVVATWESHPAAPAGDLPLVVTRTTDGWAAGMFCAPDTKGWAHFGWTEAGVAARRDPARHLTMTLRADPIDLLVTLAGQAESSLGKNRSITVDTTLTLLVLSVMPRVKYDTAELLLALTAPTVAALTARWRRNGLLPSDGLTPVS